MTLSLDLTMTYKMGSFLLIPVESCWLRWSWLQIDCNLTSMNYCISPIHTQPHCNTNTMKAVDNI